MVILQRLVPCRMKRKKHKLAVRCLKPLLLAELPADPTKPDDHTSIATLFFFDFSLEKDCTEGFKFKDNDAVAGGVAQMAIQLPGGIPLTKPLYFDYGKEKMHASLAAFGLQKLAPGQIPALVGTTAMLYHGHILG